MADVFYLNEFNLGRFAWSCLARGRPYVLAVRPFLAPLQRSLDRLANVAVRSGKARWAVELCPDLQRLWDYPTLTLFHDVFGTIEPWHNRHYRYESADRLGRYAMAYRHAGCNHGKSYHLHVVVLEAILKAIPNARCFGIPAELVEAMEEYWGRSFRGLIATSRAPHALLNTLSFIVAAIGTSAWILRRLRLSCPPPRQVFFMADYHADKRDFPLYREVSDGGQVVLVQRSPEFGFAPDISGFAQCTWKDGRFGLWGGIAALANAWRDMAALALRLPNIEPRLFWLLVALPYRRAVIRAMFNLYAPRFFWGRDDYNDEHILRRQELARIGGESLGISHGFQISATKYPMWNYIDFDRYYVVGIAPYRRHLHSTWARDMSVKAVGSFGFKREDYVLAGLPKGDGIVVFSGMNVGDPAMIAFVRDLAAALPERRILLQVKGVFADLPVGIDYVARCTEGLLNVVPTREPMLALFKSCRYVFSDPSTVVLEALQMGCYAFMIDVISWHRVCILREFPGICVTNGGEAARRIRDIESGSFVYRRAAYADLVDISGRNRYDVIRADMGLPCRENPMPSTRSAS